MFPFGWQNPATLWRLQRYVQAALSPEIAQEIHANKRIASQPKTKKMNKRSKLSVTPWVLLHPRLHASWFHASSSYKVIRWTCLEWLVFVVFHNYLLDVSVNIFLGSAKVIRDFSNNIWNFLISHIAALKFQSQLPRIRGPKFVSHSRPNRISFKHMSLWCPFLDPHLTTHYSNIGVWLR